MEFEIIVLFFPWPLLKLWLKSKFFKLNWNTYKYAQPYSFKHIIYHQTHHPTNLIFEVLGFHYPSGPQNRILSIQIFICVYTLWQIKRKNLSVRWIFNYRHGTRKYPLQNISITGLICLFQGGGGLRCFCHYYAHHLVLILNIYWFFFAIFYLILLVNFEF